MNGHHYYSETSLTLQLATPTDEETLYQYSSHDTVAMPTILLPKGSIPATIGWINQQLHAPLGSSAFPPQFDQQTVVADTFTRQAQPRFGQAQSLPSQTESEKAPKGSIYQGDTIKELGLTARQATKQDLPQIGELVFTRINSELQLTKDHFNADEILRVIKPELIPYLPSDPKVLKADFQQFELSDDDKATEIAILTNRLEHAAINNPRGDVLTIYDGDTLVACASLYEFNPNSHPGRGYQPVKDTPYALIYDTTVHPNYSGKGIGTDLQQALFQRAKDLGYDVVFSMSPEKYIDHAKGLGYQQLTNTSDVLTLDQRKAAITHHSILGRSLLYKTLEPPNQRPTL